MNPNRYSLPIRFLVSMILVLFFCVRCANALHFDGAGALTTPDSGSAPVGSIGICTGASCGAPTPIATCPAGTQLGPITTSVLALDPSGVGSLTTTGNGSLNAFSSVVVDSSSSSAVVVTGNGFIRAKDIFIVGNLSGGLGTPPPPPGALIQMGNPTVIHVGAKSVADPLKALGAPDPSKLKSFPAASISLGTVTLSPGVYAGGISISGNASVTLQSGIYYLQGGGLSVSGNATLAGSGVLIYNAPANPADQVQISGNAAVILSPAASGTYKGIVLFQARASSEKITLSGNGKLNITGTFYAAAAPISVSGNGDACIGSQFISDSLNITGNSDILVAPGAGGTPVPNGCM